MNRRYMLAAAACLAAFAAVADGPTDNLRSDYRNPVYTNGLGTASGSGNAKQNGVSLGLGSGVYWTTNRYMYNANGSYTRYTTEASLISATKPANFRSTIGVPISAISANKFLGEPLDPPANWDGKEPVISSGTGGIAVWVDFAHAVFTAQAGPIEVRWGLSNGTTNIENSVVSASPSKRPVRLYWTHQRPSWFSDSTVIRPLQNAGPTVSFGSNYKVHLYGTHNIKVLNGNDGKFIDEDGSEQWYSQDDGNGYVRLDGGELQALEGSRGTFLIIYSRLDETLNERVMLAYEVVEVLEPTQTQIDVGIGDQLRPLTRTFDTNELFPMVTRGLTDDADQDEIYVYQHMAGKQKNYLWAIRDSHENPWKIEVYWRAKEELDVVWPFEVDIYSASWKDENAQVYLRNGEGHENGEVEAEPKVLIPGSVAVEAMDYQVPKKHVHVENGAFYTDYADNATYALLKYTAGDTVWFQTVKSILHTNSTARIAYLAKEIEAPQEYRWDEAEDGFFYPGWIRRDFRTSNPKLYPIANAFNPAAYRFPAEWTTTNKLNSQIFPVNNGQLEVWWSKLSNLNGEIREGSGHIEKLSTHIFFPTAAHLYSVRAPDNGPEWDNTTPQIVLASGLGSSGWSLNDTMGAYAGQYVRVKYPEGWTWETSKASKALCLDINWGIQYDESHPYEGYFTTTVPGSGTNNSFTVENWISFLEYGEDAEGGFDGYRGRDIERGVAWLSFYSIDAEGTVSSSPRLSLRVDGNANIWVNNRKKTAFTEIPNPLFNHSSCIYAMSMAHTYTNRAFHVALVRDGENGKFRYYVNGMPAAEFDAGEKEVFEGGNRLVIFPHETTDPTFYTEEFHGNWRLFRLWSEALSHERIHDYRYVQLDPVNTMLLQYGDQEFIDDGRVTENGALVQNTLIDSSSNKRHASYGFYVGDIEEDDGTGGVYTRTINVEAYKWIRRATKYSPIPIPVEGRTFPTSAQIYRQTDPEQDGYNPNEEHAFMVGNIAYALRCDLNQMGTNGTDFTSLPYVLLQYVDPSNATKFAMSALRVVPENDMYRFRKFLDAGLKIQSLAPLNRFQPANLQKFISGPLYGDTVECFKDRKDWYWAHQAGDDGGTTNYVFEFSYPHQEQFDYPDGDAPEVGTEIGFLEGYTGRDDSYLSVERWGNIPVVEDYENYNFMPVANFAGRAEDDDPETPIDYTFIVKWPDDVKGLYVNDTLIDAKDGLPAIDGQLSVKVIYDQSSVTNGRPSVKLIDPTRIQYGSLKELPDDVRNYRDARTNKTKFNDLPPLLRDRFVWNPMAIYDLDHNDTRELELSGKIIREISYTYAWLNVMDARAKDVLTNPELLPGGDNVDWTTAIRSMPGEVCELKSDDEPFDSIALATTGRGAGYVTLVMNNSTNEEMVAKSEVVAMYVIKVVPELYSGYLHPILSDNPLDQQMNMKYTADFGGTPENWEFEWKYCEPVNGTWNSDSNQWFAVGNTSPGSEMLDWITIGDAGIFGLSDHYVRCRYRPKEGTDAYELLGDGWSNWSTPCLAEGWIKRVLKAINPFEQRIKDYYNTQISTELSMIQQAGSPYNGDIPLNLEALNANGLIAIYETVLRQARKLSIDAGEQTSAALSLALQMAAGRIAELYMVLGNEALADAMNPTVDLGNGSPVDDGAESSIFPFQNQCENLLDEELCLLRGRDLSMQYERAWSEDVEPWAYPYYNRLQWNFTHDIMGGHVAYTLNYGIKDVAGAATADDPDKPDGSIDVYDAVKLYPQGHGDAYGHYLSAVKGYYSLLRHPSFGWYPQIESILAGTVDITMSYFHEKRFALAAQAKAKTAAKIVADTYRQNYVANIEDPWMEAEDDSDWRAWGTDEWATRGHMGAYYDWLVVNALLPTREAEDRTLVKMLDRESTYELGSLAASAKTIQLTADYADVGLNPLGLADNAIPFDISPSEIDAGKTHFEQIFDRAVKAAKTAQAIFKRAKKNANALRDQNENADFEHMVADEEAAIDRRLKEIYGYPYADDIGVGKLYPQGYDGPDLYHYNYVETYDLDQSGHAFGRYYDVLVNDYKLITTNCVGTFESDAERLEADYGILGNIVAGAITLYQKYSSELSAFIDPYLSYGGISTGDKLKLPVSMIDTGADHLDGKVDYDFSVAAWSNAAFYASYYVGAYGFTPKPSTYKGQRRAEGEVQIALIDYAAQLAAIEQEAKNVEAAATKLRGLIDALTTKDYDTQMGYVTDAAAAEVQAYNDAVKKNAETIKNTLDKLKDIKSIISEVASEALPKVVGMASDISSLGRSAFAALKQAAHELINQQMNQQQSIIEKAETEAEKLQKQLNEKFSTYQANEERQKMVASINEQIPVFKAALAKLEVAFNTANATRMKYAKLEAEGDELQNERERIRIQWAADLSQKRYRNMMYQILRDDELQRYSEAFELASKYVFLAAKAYDYETGLVQSDSSASSGSQFLSEIVRSRALGRFAEDGAPLGGGSLGDPGLADILYRMGANWDVLKTRLGFNNAQDDLDSFSLRKDLFGRSLGADGDTAWRNDLASCWCDDLRTHPAFAAHCQPFDPMQDVEPGFAIPFSTVVAARKDLFGNDLAGGSTAYSSTYFATKLRGVGVWMETTDPTGASLPTRPEVYLVPSGLDYMRVPIRSSSSAVAAVRTWQVVDQTIPVPYSLTDTDWTATDWSALKDICANELANVRRHPAIRAQVGPSFSEGGLVYNARLIGRSVWNDQWYIFIPAASLNANNDRARAAFLNSVKDIHLSLKTYSLSGN